MLMPSIRATCCVALPMYHMCSYNNAHGNNCTQLPCTMGDDTEGGRRWRGASAAAAVAGGAVLWCIGRLLHPIGNLLISLHERAHAIGANGPVSGCPLAQWCCSPAMRSVWLVNIATCGHQAVHSRGSSPQGHPSAQSQPLCRAQAPPAACSNTSRPGARRWQW